MSGPQPAWSRRSRAVPRTQWHPEAGRSMLWRGLMPLAVVLWGFFLSTFTFEFNMMKSTGARQEVSESSKLESAGWREVGLVLTFGLLLPFDLDCCWGPLVYRPVAPIPTTAILVLPCTPSRFSYLLRGICGSIS